MADLLSAKDMGSKLTLSKRQIFRLNSSGKIPAPVRIGGSIRWNGEEISEWINCGCPERHIWESAKMQAKDYTQKGGGHNAKEY
jgi:prophage regulatory protein